ncbi:MAG: hypothetical protein ACP5OG_01710 [Candidatus Nanoarchaeia archaeon]
MENILISLIIILIGTLNLFFSLRFLNNPNYARGYIKNSPKAYLLRKLFGEEKSYYLTRKIFAPIGIVFGILLILLGLFLAFFVYPNLSY